jgi:hypothetical protein
MSLTVIFPMAGVGSRFGYEFKPFIKATEDTFIELAKKSFDGIDPAPRFVFTFQKCQEEQHGVSARLKDMFPKDDMLFHTIDPTDGPFQTLHKTVTELDLRGPCFVCDCDHGIDIAPVLETFDALKGGDDHFVIVPTWRFKESDAQNWGKVSVDTSTNLVEAFCEKEKLESQTGAIRGLIGCYLFSHIEDIVQHGESHQNLSDVFEIMRRTGKKNQFVPVEIRKAEFFGTPALLQNYRFERAKKYTLLVDIDGTLVHQTSKEVLPGTIERFREWKHAGHTIVLTTAVASAREKEVVAVLSQHGIPYDVLLCGLTSGPRVVINDRKPYLPFYPMSEAVMVHRNEGIVGVRLPDEPPVIIKELPGASFARVYLVRGQDGSKFVRKFVPRASSDLVAHADKLKRQYEDMKRFEFLSPGIHPRLIGSYESPSGFYYDLDYLEGFETLSSYDAATQVVVVCNIFRTLFESVYCVHRPLADRKRWLNDFLRTKIAPNLAVLSTNDVMVNGVVYGGVETQLENLKPHFACLAPNFECPIHGDLTMENIMFRAKDDTWKLIDNDGSRYMDAVELDLGKVFQSIVCKYALWKDGCEAYLEQVSETEYRIQGVILDIPDDKMEHVVSVFESAHGVSPATWIVRGLFYMTTHLIRMIPYMKQKRGSQALFAELLARVYLKRVHNILEDSHQNIQNV